jgi:hypothetical protein
MLLLFRVVSVQSVFSSNQSDMLKQKTLSTDNKEDAILDFAPFHVCSAVG